MRQCPTDKRRLLSLSAFAAGGNDPLLGATLASRYTITGRIGSGNMGTVYRAEQAPLAREVAFKVLRRDMGRDPETVARFEREAVTLSQLRHPNTVTVLDAGRTEDGQLFLAMELLEGEMLSTRLKRVGWLSVEEALRVAMGVLRSLDEAHARGIIHRDLKPDNIFLAQVHGRPDEAEVVKVVDFGIAKIRDGDRPHGLDPLKTAEGTVFGTPRYMSPEQAQGKPIDGRSDLYAVGVLLFHMLTGDPPFTEDDAVVVMAHHIKTIPPRLRTIAPGRNIPEELEQLVSRGLAKDPLLRPQTAQEFLALLEGVRDVVRNTPVPMTVPPATSTYPPPITSAPRRSWAQIAAVAAAVTLGLVGFTRLVAPPAAPALPRSTTTRTRLPAPPPMNPATSTPIARPEAVPAPTPAPAAPLPAPEPPADLTLAAEAPSLASHRRHRRHHRRHRDEAAQQQTAPTAEPAPAPAAPRTASSYDRWND